MAARYILPDIIERHAHLSSAREQVALLSEGAEFTYRHLNERSRRLANALVGLDVGKGDRVAVLMGNSQIWPEVLFATASVGAVCVAVNVLLQGPDVSFIIEDCGAVAIFADHVAEKALAAIGTLPPRLIRVGDVEMPSGAHVLDYEGLIGRAADTPIADRPTGDDPAMMYYTSGTTGRPKGAVHSHSGILWNSYHQIGDVGLVREHVYLLIPSLSWAAGFHDVMLGLMWLGGKVVMLPTGGLTIDRILHAIETQGVTDVLLVPTLLKQLIATPGAVERLRRTRIRKIYTGAEPVPPNVIGFLNTELPNCGVIQIYGMSEFPLMMTILEPADCLRDPALTGKASSIVSLAVRSPSGEITDRGEGEVLIRSPATMLGYHGREADTREAFRDGWFATGDTGSLDEQGFLTLTGRSKDMIISGGMNIYPREIENVIHKINGVADVAVVAVSNDKWGEIPVAVVCTERGPDLEEEIAQACASQLSSYKRPKRILRWNGALPRTPTGKVLKRDIRPWAQALIGTD